MKILAVIPARKNSKGIPRKNMRFLHGQPLISYAINNALACNEVSHIVVSSDDDETLLYASQLGADAVVRPTELGEDTVTLDPVIHHALCAMEEKLKCKFDYVITLQPTAPLLKSDSLSGAVRFAIDCDYDTVISAVDNPHLTWGKTDDGYFPKYEQRLNRQQLPPCYTETGAFVISKREVVAPNTRIGNNICIYELPPEQAVDIDSYSDWYLCESVLKSKSIVFRVDGNQTLGMGHIYHTLTLAYRLTGHNITFVSNKEYQYGIDKIKSSYFPLVEIDDDEGFFTYLDRVRPDIVVNDCLNTTKAYMNRIRECTDRLIAIEDVGEGTSCADAVVNALYEDQGIHNSYSGAEYACLREEFLLAAPKRFLKEVRRIFVMFGGSDPNNYTKMIYDLAWKNTNKEITFDFVTGLAYDADKHGVFTIGERNINVHNNPASVSAIMREADIAIIGQGRTIFEVAVLGIPSMVLAQNRREQLHMFASLKNGFISMGLLGEDVSAETIERTLKWLLETPQIRAEMRESMLSADIKAGVDRVCKIILGD